VNSLEHTPALDRALSRVHRRLVAGVLAFGVGTALLAAAGWLVFAFVADYGLHVPRAVRLLHALVFALLPAVVLWRFLVRPLRRVPSADGIAVLVERRHPEPRELLVTAAQLQRTPDGDPALVERVLRDADESARDLDTTGVVRGRGPLLRLVAGGAATVVILGAALTSPMHASIFAHRMLGRPTPWPQRTHLSVEIPLRDQTSVVERTADLISVRVARGSDVPVVVTADGAHPDSVVLHLADGQEVVVPASGRGRYRQVMRSLQEDVAFHVTGGDDLDGLPVVEVTVLQPPDVAGIAVRVEPPAYTGLPSELFRDRDVEVIAGSRLSVAVLPDPPEATGIARVLPEDAEIALAPVPWPAASGEGGELEGPEVETPGLGGALGFEIVAERSMHFRVELVDDTGLGNPDPGLFAVRVVEDRPPELTVLAPSRSEVETVRGGALPLRVRVEDDFGVAALSWSAEAYPAGEEEGVGAALALHPLADADGVDGSAAAPRRALGRARIEVADLGPPGRPVAEGQQFLVEFAAEDIRMPEPGRAQSAPVRVRVVTPDDLLRRVQDRLSHARLDAGELYDLQHEKRARVMELLDALSSDDPGAGGDALLLQAALSGQRRVEGDALAIGRELAGVAETIVYARLDEKAGALLEQLDIALGADAERGFRSAPWREVAAALAEGRLGAPGFARHLVELVALALEVGEDRAVAAAEALAEAQAAPEAAARADALARAIELQSDTLAGIEELQGRLAEWDSFQSVLTLTRDILGRQRALRDRTKAAASDG
jgi:hypothetical protein